MQYFYVIISILWLLNTSANSSRSDAKVIEIRLAVYLDEPLVDHLSNHLSMNTSQMKSLVQAYISQTDSIIEPLRSKNIQRIHLKLARVELKPLKMPNDELRSGNLDILLSKFCLYQMNEKRQDHDWHLALLLTQRHLYSFSEEITSSSNEDTIPETMGMSPVGGIRWPDLSCLVIKFATNGSITGELSNLQSPSVVAHEIAHSLGIHHDHEGCEPDAVMSPTCQMRKGSKKWSDCSITALDELEKLDFLSVTNYTRPSMNLEDLPGQLVDKDTQCKLHHSSFEYLTKIQTVENICLDSLLCQARDGNSIGSQVPVGPAWEGTACGRNKVCLRGACRVISRLSTYLHD